MEVVDTQEFFFSIPAVSKTSKLSALLINQTHKLVRNIEF